MKRAAIIQGHLHAEAAATTEPYELVIRGAKVYEAEGHAPGALLDVAVRAGKIAAVEPAGTIAPGSGREEFDAAGLLLTPGLIDMHVHCFAGMTALGIEVDEWCLGRGCTTVCDAGSAGATTVEGFIRYIDGQNLTRCLSFLNISLHGLAGSGGAYAHANQIKVEPVVDSIAKYPDHIVGVKVLLTASYAAGGRNELEALRAALAATNQAGVPLMCHHSSSIVPLNPHKPRLEQHELPDADLGAPYSLRPGDIYTHCFHAFKSTIIDGGSHIQSIDPGNGAFAVVPNPDGAPAFQDFHVSETVWAAKRRGVLFDVGHGSASFSWTVAEIAAREGFWPDIISTDIHQGSCYGPAYDMPTSMTKMLMIGMPLAEVIRASTATPAAAIGRSSEFGRIAVVPSATPPLPRRLLPAPLLRLVWYLIFVVSTPSLFRAWRQTWRCWSCWKAPTKSTVSSD